LFFEIDEKKKPTFLKNIFNNPKLEKDTFFKIFFCRSQKCEGI